MKKALWLVLLIVALLAIAVTTTLAGGDNHRHRWDGDRFALVGQVTAVDTVARTITVNVWMGNRAVKDYIDDDLLVTTTEDTRFRRFDDPECVFIAFEDIEVDAYVSVGGNVDADDFLALRVTVDVPLDRLQ